MASMEQLQMLNDDESTTSSSSRSNSDDEEDENVGNDYGTTSNDDDPGDDDGIDTVEAASSKETTVSSVNATMGHHKKIVKLSLGGTAVKAEVVSSSGPEQESKQQIQQSTKSNATATPKEDNLQSKVKSTPCGDEGTGVGTATTIAVKLEDTKKEESSQQQPVAAATSATRKTALPPSTKENKSKEIKSKSKPKTAGAVVKTEAKELKRRQPPKLPSSSSAIGGDTYAPPTKKRSSMRSIRITPMSSPGLMLVRGGGGGGTAGSSANDKSSISFPNSAFTQTMTTAGYTMESRKETPHRGSSVQRSVDDMFDSNVKFCLRFPKLVPEDLVTTTTTTTAAPQQSSSSDPSTIKPKEEIESAQDSTTLKSRSTEDHAVESKESKTIPNLMKRLSKAFQAKTNGTSEKGLSRIPQYSDIVPISLSSAYPNEYIQKRLEYARKVNEREKAIVDMQEKQEALQTSPEASTRKQTNAIPPIPRPPDVPKRENLRAITNVEEIFGSEDQQQRSHPLYLPKNKAFVNHLDGRCFHAIDGRYFGLISNAIADPYFVGPNAPGIGGLNLSASTGLATASTGGGAGALGTPLFMVPAQQSSSSAASSKTVPTSSIKSASSNINTIEKSTKSK